MKCANRTGDSLRFGCRQTVALFVDGGPLSAHRTISAPPARSVLAPASFRVLGGHCQASCAPTGLEPRLCGFQGSPWQIVTAGSQVSATAMGVTASPTAISEAAKKRRDCWFQDPHGGSSLYRTGIRLDRRRLSGSPTEFDWSSPQQSPRIARRPSASVSTSTSTH